MNIENTKILILQRILPHYRVGFFEYFCKKYSDAKVLFGQPMETESLKNSGYTDNNFFTEIKNIYFNKSGKIFLSNIYSEILKYRPDVIISVFNVGNLNIYLLFLLKQFLGFKLILWSFGYDPVKGFNPDKRFTDKIRLLLSQKADAVIFYWEKGKAEISNFSERTEHYFIAPNTLDTNKLFNYKNLFDKTGSDIIKKELGLKEKHNFIYVGRLLKDKEVEVLLEAFSKIETTRDDCRLTIIGDGPELQHLKDLSVKLKLQKITFSGEILDDETTGKWIYVNDAFIMPGRLGLSVVHSFCFGTPVISQMKEDHFHGEGIGYIKNGENGFLIRDGDVNELSEKMNELISDQMLLLKLKQNAFDTAKNDCSIEIMTEGFDNAISYVLKNKNV